MTNRVRRRNIRLPGKALRTPRCLYEDNAHTLGPKQRPWCNNSRLWSLASNRPCAWCTFRWTIGGSRIPSGDLFLERTLWSVAQLVQQVNIFTDALLSIGADFESFVTFARVRSLGVDAMAVLAQIAVGRTFVDVSAVIGQTNLLISLRTDAHERTDEVLASEFAIVGRRGAFVHVCLHQRKLNGVRRI